MNCGTINNAGSQKPLFECHGHIFMDGEDFRAARERHSGRPDEAYVRQSLALLQAENCVYFRDGGDNLGVSLLARELAPEYGIEYVTPAFAIHRKGHYGGIVGKSYSDMKEFRQLVEDAKTAGADFIKIMTSGIITFKRYGELSCDSVSADETAELVRIAHGEGFSVMVHVNGDEAVAAASCADSIEHGYFCGDKALEAMAGNGCIWVPTLSAVKGFCGRDGFAEGAAEKTLFEQESAVKKGRELGITIAPGSDSGAYGVPHGYGTRLEYSLLESLGFKHDELKAAGGILKERFKR